VYSRRPPSATVFAGCHGQPYGGNRILDSQGQAQLKTAACRANGRNEWLRDYHRNCARPDPLPDAKDDPLAPLAVQIQMLSQADRAQLTRMLKEEGK
jgi:hypothetical protein